VACVILRMPARNCPVPAFRHSQAAEDLNDRLADLKADSVAGVARAPKERAELFLEQLSARGLRVTIEPD